jgi:hypothetical protein
MLTPIAIANNRNLTQIIFTKHKALIVIVTHNKLKLEILTLRGIVLFSW